MSFCLPPNMGWIFNTIVPANITGEATHRRATCGNASNPCTIKAVDDRRREVNKLSWTVHRRIAVKGGSFGAGQSRPVVLMSVLGGDRDGCGRTRPCDFACGLFAPHRDRLILAPPLAAPDRQVALQVMPGGRRGGLGQINLVAWFPKADCCAARRRSVIPGPEAREYLQ